jgi:hypothetical protein
MDWQAAIIVLILAIAAGVIGLPALRRFQAPKAGTERLAITVWAAFGPYESAQDAEDSLRRAGRAVFGSNGVDEHEEWIQGHVRNFKEWEAEDRFVAAHNFMRNGLLLTGYGQPFEKACQTVKEEIVNRGLEAMEHINKDFLEAGGHKLEAVKQPDGSLQFMYKQIWSDEEIKRKERQDSEAVLNAIGRNLSEDQSNEAKKLLAFLSNVYQTNMGKDLETPKDVGAIWFACLEVVDKDPDSEVAQTFKVLNDAWTSTRAKEA